MILPHLGHIFLSRLPRVFLSDLGSRSRISDLESRISSCSPNTRFFSSKSTNQHGIADRLTKPPPALASCRMGKYWPLPDKQQGSFTESWTGLCEPSLAVLLTRWTKILTLRALLCRLDDSSLHGTAPLASRLSPRIPRLSRWNVPSTCPWTPHIPAQAGGWGAKSHLPMSPLLACLPAPGILCFLQQRIIWRKKSFHPGSSQKTRGRVEAGWEGGNHFYPLRVTEIL